jgi:hypothetical protein
MGLGEKMNPKRTRCLREDMGVCKLHNKPILKSFSITETRDMNERIGFEWFW